MSKANVGEASRHFDEVLQEAQAGASRRQILRGGLGLSALSFLGLAGCGGGDSTAAAASPLKALNFTATPLNQTYDGVSVASGYKAEVLFRLGDPINATTPAYLNNGTETSASFDFRAGDHHDGMYFFGLGSNNQWNKAVSDKGILCINHEAITPLFLHATGPTPATGNRTVADEVQKEFRLHGVSVVEVNKVNGAFQVKLDSTFNRRITTLTDMDIAGPLRGHNLLKTKYSPTGVKTRGTINNCASGYTPWGTYLTCEENYAGYFKRSNTTGRSANELASEARNGVTSTSGRERWSSISDASPTDDYARWDITRAAAGADPAGDYSNAANTFGFNVEIDPFAPTSTPKKRTAMGRFAHEGAWVGPVTVGKPVVFYMGCDSRGEYIYKFVSTALWVASDVNRGMAAGDKYLDDGKLYVARFNSDFSGEWLELSNLAGTQAAPSSTTFTFGDATSDAYLNTRLSADKKGATPMDRPEWGAVNPVNGEVYITLTNNSNRTVALTDAANPRSYADNTGSSTGNANGHIIRWRETGSNPAATSFTWDIYVFGAEGDDVNNKDVNLSGLTADNFLSSPDGLWFSEKTGILYIQTDDSAFTNEVAPKQGTTCMLLAAIPGTVGDGSTVTVTNTSGSTTKTVTTKVGKTGELKRLLTGPIESEITGITESYDGKALFINIQHPGEDTAAANIASPTSSWPYSTASGNPATATTAKSARPRSATIVLTRIDGGIIGTDFSLS